MKKISALILVSIIIITTTGCNLFSGGADKMRSEMRDITTMEVTREMGVGINLGNTFEAVAGISSDNPSDYEVSWGSPIITKELIKGYADEGFGVLRIPVAWSNMMEEDYTISPAYMKRVKEVVEWTLQSGMYAILNIHWDGGWWKDFPDKPDECMYRYERFWTQISDEFKDYNDYLMFESLNEELGWDELWNRHGDEGDKAASFDLANKINQKFVDIVRASGGKNGERHLLIAGYNTDFHLTSDEMFKMPNDEMNRCAVSVHYYTPATFCLLDKEVSWGKPRTEWGNEADFKELNDNFDLVKERFIDNGIPVIVGEYGVTTSNKTDEVIRLYMASVTEAAYSRQMCPVVWDVTDVFYDRTTFKMKDQELLRQLMAVKEEG